MSLFRVGDLPAPEEGAGLRVQSKKESISGATNNSAVFNGSAAIWREDFVRARLPEVFPAEAAIGGVDRDRVMGGGEIQNAVVNERA
jgi:hypothetical protein